MEFLLYLCALISTYVRTECTRPARNYINIKENNSVL